jgi:Ca-activated chloride channel family protein
MKFAEPYWLLAGLLVCALLLWAWRLYDARQKAALSTFAAAHLHAQLTASFSSTRQNWKRGLFLASISCAFLALSRPQVGFRWEEVKRRGIEVIFAVDTSRSMLAPDVKPNRLARAKLAVHDFVNHLDGDGVGLVAFAGNAFLQCPVTLDYDAFNETLDALDTTIIPEGGTDIATAIQETQAALKDRTSAEKILILLTDGEDLAGSALTAAKEASEDGLKIYTIGVGTTGGDLIPLPDQSGGFVKDDSGQFVKSHLDESGLKAIAEATGGLYAPLGNQGQGLESIYQKALAPLVKHELASRRQKVYSEQFQWPLAASLGLLMASLLIGTRRRTTVITESPAAEPVRTKRATVGAAAGLALLLFVPTLAQASPKTAEKAYQKGDYETAQREYDAAAKRNPKKPDLQYNAGAAAYKGGQFDQAAESFQKSLESEPSANPKRLAVQENAYYNLGNSLYRLGQQTEQSDAKQTIQKWEQAVKTYEAALQIRTNDVDAKFNHDLVKRKLEELKKQQDQKQDKSDQNQDQKDKDKQEQDKKDQSDKKNDQAQQDQKKDEKSGEDKKSDAKDQQQDNKDSKSEQQKQADQKKSDSAKDQQQANSGEKKDEQKQADTKKQAAKPDKKSAEEQEQAQAAADQKKDQEAQSAETKREPGKMTRAEALSLLDSLKQEQRRLPASPMDRRGDNSAHPDKPLKNW